MPDPLIEIEARLANQYRLEKPELEHDDLAWACGEITRLRARVKAAEAVAEAAEKTSHLIDSLVGLSMGSLHPNDFANQVLKMSLTTWQATRGGGQDE